MGHQCSYLVCFIKFFKGELLQLNRTQFPYLGIFVSKKKLEIEKTNHFYYISFKICILDGLSFFKIQLFY